jgi:hypothetical protein
MRQSSQLPMSDTCCPSAISQTRADHGKTPDIRTSLRPLCLSRGLALSAAVAWLIALSPTDLSAGPKYRAFQNTRSSAVPATDVRLVAATTPFQGEVSDSPPVFIDGQFTTIGDTTFFKSFFNKPQKPVATIEKVSPESEHHYLVRANSLQHGLARMAALYSSLGNLR